MMKRELQAMIVLLLISVCLTVAPAPVQAASTSSDWVDPLAGVFETQTPFRFCSMLSDARFRNAASTERLSVPSAPVIETRAPTKIKPAILFLITLVPASRFLMLSAISKQGDGIPIS